MALNGGVLSKADFTLTKSSGLPTALSIPIGDQARLSLANGTVTDQANRIYYKQLSLAGAVTDLDLTNLTDPFGDALAFVEIAWGRVVNLSTANVLTIGGAGAIANAWTAWLSNPGTITVKPKTSSYSGYVEIGSGFDPGYAVDSTHKFLRLDPGANTFSVIVVLVGRDA